MKKEVNYIPELRFHEFDDIYNLMTLGDFTTFGSGGTPSKNEAAFWDGNIPWISASSMRGNIYNSSDLCISEIGLKNGSRLTKEGTILLLVRGSMLFNKIPVGIAGKDVAFNQDVKSISVSHDLTSRYLFQWFKAKEHLLLSMVVATGIGAGKLDTQDLKSLSAYLPSLSEQQKIASFLFAVDKKIEQLKRKKELLEQFKKGVKQKIFSREIRFKDDNGKDYPDWKEKKVVDIFKVTRGQVLAVSKTTPLATSEKPFPVYSSQTKNAGLMGYFDKFLFENSITWTTDGANAGDVNYREGKFYCTNVCGVLVSDKGYANQFIAEVLNSVTRRYVSYVGNPKLMNNVMGEIKIFIPSSVDEQRRISLFFSSIDDKITIVKNQLAQNQNFKKGLLQKMFV